MVPSLVDDVERLVSARSAPGREGALRQVTTLFLNGAPGFNEAHVALFDDVIQRLAAAIEVRARAELAEALADVPNAPPGVVRRLAHDEIAVARPVLARSARLTDDDLVSVAVSKGRDHMLAITERAAIEPVVADLLAAHGDRVVVNALAANPGAAFSPVGYRSLIERARADELLLAALRARADLPREHLPALVEIAKLAARARLARDEAGGAAPALVVGEALERAARRVGEAAGRAPRDYAAAERRTAALAAARPVTPEDLAKAAAGGGLEDAVCLLAHLAAVPRGIAERALLAPETDLALICARAVGLPFAGLKALLALKTGGAPGPRAHDDLADGFARLAPATAVRVLRFMHVRDAARRGG